MQIQGHWYALMNWRARGTRTDTVVLRPMSPSEVDTYQTLAQGGFLEAAIFAQLYPPKREPEEIKDVVVPVSLLQKRQIAALIENKLGVSLPTLARMDKEDLVRLLGGL